MCMKDVQETGPSTRAIIGWAAGSLILLAGLVSSTFLWTRCKKECARVDAVHSKRARKLEYLEAIADLGGRELAAARLGFYLRSPERLAGNKVWVAKTLGYLHEDAAGQLPALRGLLTHGDEEVREAALRAIGNIGPSVEFADDLLAVIAAGDEKTDVRAAALWCLCRIRPRSPKECEQLVRALSSVIRDKSTPQHIRAEATKRAGLMRGNASGAPAWKREIEYKLGRCIDVEFVEVPSRKALQHIGQLVGVEVRFAKSYDYDMPVTIRMNDVSAKLVLLWVGKLSSVYSAEPTKDGILVRGHEGPL